MTALGSEFAVEEFVEEGRSLRRRSFRSHRHHPRSAGIRPVFAVVIVIILMSAKDTSQFSSSLCRLRRLRHRHHPRSQRRMDATGAQQRTLGGYPTQAKVIVALPESFGGCVGQIG